jgi:hypothetical protein
MTKEAKRVIELEADIIRWSADLEFYKGLLSRNPNDKMVQEDIAGLESVILRAKSYIKAVA